jgi:xanthine dehydrogenase accessory factor
VRDILDSITKWWEAGEDFGLATVVRTFSSAPREPGASMAVSPDGEVVGSVSGGCVEGAVYDLAGEVRASGQPVLRRYGISDDDAFAVGLTCGGIIDIFVEPASKKRFSQLGEVAEAVRREVPVALATIIEGPGEIGARRMIWEDQRATGTLGAGDRLDQAVDDDARGMADRGAPLRSRRRATPGGTGGVRPVLRPGAADAGVRSDRLRGRSR